jgi:multiple sugar transport system permease protein
LTSTKSRKASGAGWAATLPPDASTQPPGQRRWDRAAIGFLAPSGIGFLLFVIFPAVMVFGLSAVEWNLLSPARFVGWDNYLRAFSDSRLLAVYRSTALMAGGFVVLNVGLALLLAVFLETRMPRWLSSFFRMTFIFPFVVSATAVAMIWRFMLHQDLGLVNFYLGGFGVDKINWLGSSFWAPISVVIAATWRSIGFSILIFIAGLQAIPQDVREAAMVDGANAWTRFWRITLPLLSPTVLFLVIVNTLGAFQLFAEPVVLTSGGPGDASRTVVQFMYNTGFGSFQMGYASAQAVLLLAVLVVLTFLQFRLSKRWTFYG